MLAKINGDDETWVKDSVFLGGWTLATKSISWPDNAARDEPGIIYSSPADEWEHACTLSVSDERKSEKKPNAEFRVMAKCSFRISMFCPRCGYFMSAINTIRG